MWLRVQGTVKQGLQRQKEAYSGKWRDLEEKARGLDDALRSARQAVSEREEQNSGLDAQVRTPNSSHVCMGQVCQ